MLPVDLDQDMLVIGAGSPQNDPTQEARAARRQAVDTLALEKLSTLDDTTMGLAYFEKIMALLVALSCRGMKNGIQRSLPGM